MASKSGIFGGTSATLSCLLMKPLDVYITRNLVKGQKGMSDLKTGFPSILKDLYGSPESIKRQTMSTAFHIFPAAGLYFFNLSILKRIVPIREGPSKIASNLVLAMAARSVSILATSPFATARTLLEVNPGLTYREALREGFRRGFRAAPSALLLGSSFSGVVFAAQQVLMSRFSLPTPIRSAIASGIGVLITHPLDVVKTRQMATGMPLGAALRTLGGGTGGGPLYSGVQWKMIRKGLGSSITFTLAETFGSTVFSAK
eukprot:gnl/Dysnectes_brevis/2045_a2362_1247.p1 GENE.gnl/Dysnectes_brevis/2045_a2362_1247~~gnl/Dysnectes_brevis/2045_a2362_1247.p1  ORF type:complete len:287 (-),score=50.96 gnl/Dysnectes_brevis/2045_a2362_1247:69-845(-)